MAGVNLPPGPAPGEPPRSSLAVATAGVAVAAFAAAALALGIQAGSATGLAAAAAAVLLLVLGAAVLGYARGVAAIREAVRNAGDETRGRARLPRLSRPLVGALARDYDTLSKHLSSLFGEMEQAQLAIIAERNRHEAILQGLPGALLVVDGDLRVTVSNQNAERLFARSGRDLAGANVFDLLQVDAATRDAIRDAFLLETPLANRVASLAVGERLHQVSLNLTFFSDSPRKPAQASAAFILQDITDWKRLEDLSRQAEKLVAMGQLAAGVAHELNTPLGTIIGYARLLEEGRADAARRDEYAKAIHQESRRCARIVDQMLAYARRDACRTETCDVNALVRESAEAVAGCQGERHCVRVETDVEGSIVVRGGQGQIDIVLVNVMVNAVQAAAGGACPLVRVCTRADGPWAVVTVTDNGPGIAPALRERIFDPFFTTKAGSEGTGTGLGLAITHSIVTRLGGSIRVDPEWRDGARFEILLPLAGSDASACR